MTKIIMDAPKPCLETHAVNMLLELGFGLEHAPKLVDYYLYLVLGGLDFVAAYGEVGMRERLQRGAESDAIRKLQEALVNEENRVARATLAQLDNSPEKFIPRLVVHYPIMEQQPILVDWNDPSMGYVAVATFAGGLKAVDNDLEQRRVLTLSALSSRAQKYNTHFKFKNRYKAMITVFDKLSC